MVGMWHARKDRDAPVRDADSRARDLSRAGAAADPTSDI